MDDLIFERLVVFECNWCQRRALQWPNSFGMVSMRSIGLFGTAKTARQQNSDSKVGCDAD